MGLSSFFMVKAKTGAAPSGAAPVFNAFLLHQAQDEGEHDKEDSDPLGPLGQLGVPGLGLVLGHEGVHAAGDGAAEAGALAGLEQNHSDEEQTGEELNNRHNNLGNAHCFHRSFRPRGGAVFSQKGAL